MKIATSPIEPVAVMTMTWRIVEPVTNLAVLPAGTVAGRGLVRGDQCRHRHVVSCRRARRPSPPGPPCRCRLASLLRLDERLRRDRLGVPGAAAGLDAFDGLQRQPLLVAAAHVLEDLAGRVLVQAERLQRLLPEAQAGFEGLAQFVVDALGPQLQRMRAVVGAHEQPGVGEFALDQVDDAVGDGTLVGADRDELGAADAGRLEHILARAVAEIEAEPEFCGAAHALGRMVDDGDAGAAGKQHLRGDLAEAREADHQHVGLGAVEILLELALPLPAR